MTTPDPNLPFRNNVRLLGDLLGKTLKVQVGEGLFDQIEMIRQLSKDACNNDEDAKRSLNTILQTLTHDQMLIVAKAFGHFLNLANIAENVHRIRRSRWHALNAPTVPSPGSIEALLVTCKKNNITKSTFDNALEKLNIDLVLTAHPTEVMRRTMMQKYESIAKLLAMIDEQSLTQVETEDVHESIYRETTAIWQTDEIRRRKPTPLDEAKWGFAIIESSLWQVVPQYLRNLNKQLLKHHLSPISLTKSPIQFSSWMGGDRDGNPNVTSQVTDEICLMARWMAADLYARDIHKLSASLSMQNANQALSQAVGQTNEPYRALLRTLRNKCFATCHWIENSLKGIKGSDENIIKSKQDLLAPLLLCYQSLVDCKAECIAQGELTDIIKRVACFGVSLTRLDIRQEAAKHSALLSEITESMGLGSYHDWDEAQRFTFLNDKLTHPEKLIKDDLVLSPMSQEVWNTFL
ncbi:MAG: phosphoenolpyruvate carboxylase, partial [Candidatus Berkiella sp.]